MGVGMWMRLFCWGGWRGGLLGGLAPRGSLGFWYVFCFPFYQDDYLAVSVAPFCPGWLLPMLGGSLLSRVVVFRSGQLPSPLSGCFLPQMVPWGRGGLWMLAVDDGWG